MRVKANTPATYYLANTQVENIFLGEYMPDAPGSYVKVYLLALMYAQTTGETDTAQIAGDLGIEEKEAEEAFRYWEDAGLVVRTDEGIEFLSLKEDLYGTCGAKKAQDKAPEVKTAPRREYGAGSRQQRIQTMFDDIEKTTNSTLGGSQFDTILGWIEDGAEPEVISAAFAYCVDRGKNNIRYVEAVVKSWTMSGLRTPEDVEEHLEKMDEKHYTYRRVMKALGFNRNPSEEERRLISSWVDELGCSMDEILDACAKTSGISNPNINYVNSVIRNRKAEEESPKTAPRAKVLQYYDKLREKAEAEAAERREEIYAKIPRIAEIDTETVDCNVELTKTLMGGSAARTDSLRGKIEELDKERSRLLTENGIPIDYMNARYSCPLCQDTGITRNGEVCRCYADVARLAAEE